MTLGPLLDAALSVQATCRAVGLSGCIIGGLALQRWGEPRYTADVDVSVLVEAGREAEIARALLERLESRISDAVTFAVRSRVILARASNGVSVDVALAGLPYEARVVERSSDWELGADAFLRTCSAEDLLVMKSFAARDKDWADVASILERQGAKLDLDLVRRELKPLLTAKEAPELIQEFEQRVLRHVK